MSHQHSTIWSDLGGAPNTIRGAQYLSVYPLDLRVYHIMLHIIQQIVQKSEVRIRKFPFWSHLVWCPVCYFNTEDLQSGYSPIYHNPKIKVGVYFQ